MIHDRPDPEALLARIREDESRAQRARLKIFFGASAGVGKTFAMLVEAHERRRSGADVVVGLVETHGRSETAALLDGLEVVKRRAVEHRGTVVYEFDLDAALARRPALILLDELAHTNAPGSRHTKRWQDVEELLEAGIDVYTTLNVQHVESLIDVVAQITGALQRETVPDSVLDRADEIELVDLPPDDLLERLREGKVYLSEQALRAADHFFRKGNLIALRELALRTTAQRVDAQMDSYRRIEGIVQPWHAGGRFVVGIGDPSAAPRLIRAARRMAVAFKAQWVVVHVERPGEAAGRTNRDQLIDVLGFAEELGAETAILSGLDVADELLAYSRTRNASRLVLGKPTWRPAWRLWQRSLVDAVVRSRAEIDVFVVRGEADEREPRPAPAAPVTERAPRAAYVRSLLVVATATGVAALMRSRFGFEASNLIMVYLLGVMWVAVTLGRGPAVLASVLSVATFDFFFVPPYLTFAVTDTQYVVTFVVMLLAAILISTLAARLREQAVVARRDERRSVALSKLSGELAGLQERAGILEAAVRHVGDVFDCRAVMLLPDESGRVAYASGARELLGDDDHERGVAQWVFDSARPAGLGTATLPGSRCLFLPLRASQRELGVLGIAPADVRRVLAPDAYRLLEAFTSQTALALERGELAREAERARVRAETEQMRSALLSSVSHDLRTPLAAITGAATSLLDESGTLPAPTRREMMETIADEAGRLNRLVSNLLQMTRLEAGVMSLQRGWHSLEEVIGAALQRVAPLLAGRPVATHVPSDLPLVLLDDVLIEQVVFNLLENATKYAPPSGRIDVSARRAGDTLEVEVADRGPGLPAGEEEQVFVKFHRAGSGRAEGVGLGLAICKGIVEAHGGRIRAANRTGGGAAFTFMLPLEGTPPIVEPEAGA
jgi:two-component system sensor histidine kinase KdpD